MFHHAHAYVATKIYQADDQLLILGSFLPDLAVMGIIKWEGGLHGKESSADFAKFILEYPAYVSLFKGVLAHNVLDDLSHLEYHTKPGYAFQNTQELAELVMKFYGLDEEGAKAKAHNFIEMAVDIKLLQDHPEIQSLIKKSIKEPDREELSKLLGTYFKIDAIQFETTLSEYWTLFTKYDFSKAENWALFWGDLEPLLSLKNIGNEKRKELLEVALSIVKNTYQDFLAYTTVDK
jgi:hypothetical protein